jgi:hypothetical protein
VARAGIEPAAFRSSVEGCRNIVIVAKALTSHRVWSRETYRQFATIIGVSRVLTANKRRPPPVDVTVDWVALLSWGGLSHPPATLTDKEGGRDEQSESRSGRGGHGGHGADSRSGPDTRTNTAIRHTGAVRPGGGWFANTTAGVRSAAAGLQSQLEPFHWGLGRAAGNRLALVQI